MNFNKEQEKIINSLKGAYLLSAPVGTGKTTVLSERIIKALDSGIRAEEILCLTFTNRAAEEMRERIRKKIKYKEDFDNLTISTFHGFCAYFIRAEAKELNIFPDFNILDDFEQNEILRNILKKYPEINSEDNQFKINDFKTKLYKRRERFTEIEIACNFKKPPENKLLDKINQEYLNALKEQNAFDFDELVLSTMRGLFLNKKIHKKWLNKFRFIQLDEFQDTHLSEYLIVKELAKKHKNITMIGDLDQTIYSWRGSRPKMIAELFKKHFAPVKEYHLTINYRFNANVLRAVKSFLNSFEDRATKKIVSHQENSKENAIEIFDAYNFNEEVDWVVDNIKKIKAKNKKASIAVLTRANYLISQIADIFKRKNIAHITVDQYDFFRRQEVRDIYAYLKIIFNKYDLESAYRIAERSKSGIGKKSLQKIREQGSECGLKISDFFDFKNYNFSEPFENLIKNWDGGRLVVLDTETTGTNVLRDEIIQIYAIEVVDGKPGKDFHYFLKNSIPVGASEAVHGISDDFLKENGKDPKWVMQELQKFIGKDAPIGHNVNFDLSIIKENGKRLGIDFNFKEYYDTLDIAKRVVQSENYRLNTLATMFNLSSATHDAKDDVLATVGLLGVLVGKLKPKQEERKNLFAKFSPKFIKLATMINSWQKKSLIYRPAKILDIVWQESGLDEFYKNFDYEKRIKSINTLKKLFKQKDDKEKSPDIVLRELISYASLVKNIDFLGLDKGKVPIVTVHQVKGLEFDYVFVLGMNDYKFPIRRAGSDMEEEKRLFYVALTRAKEKIFLSYSRFNQYDTPQAKSPFLDYLKAG